MLPGDDVFNVERQVRLVVLMTLAILAPVTGTLSNKSASRSINGHRSQPDAREINARAFS